MPDSTPEHLPLLQVQSLLSPYVRTRSEALSIRRTITAYLSSYVETTEERSRSLNLSSWSLSSCVQNVPQELAGVRKDYLEALGANIRARREQSELLRELANEDEDVRAPQLTLSATSTSATSLDGPIHSYLDLSRQRRRYHKQRILQEKMGTLGRKPAASANYFNKNELLKDLPPLPDLHVGNPESLPIKEADSKSETELVAELEKAVLRAKYRYEQEKMLLQSIKADRIKSEIGDLARNIMNGTTELLAYQNTRDELIRWMEHELAEAAATNKPIKANPLNPQMQSAPLEINIQEQMDDVRAMYEEYLHARKCLIALVSADTTKRSTKSSSDGGFTLSSVSEFSEMKKDRSLQRKLVYVRDLLLPTATQQKTIVLQKSNITTTLAKEQRVTLQTIERLCDESHLLPTYPLLSQKPRFKNVVAALGTRQEEENATAIFGSTSCGEEIFAETRAWVFASDAARDATHEHVHGHIERSQANCSRSSELIKVLNTLVANGGGDFSARRSDLDRNIATKQIEIPARLHQLRVKNEKLEHRFRGLLGELGVSDDVL